MSPDVKEFDELHSKLSHLMGWDGNHDHLLLDGLKPAMRIVLSARLHKYEIQNFDT
jgi:hypothetical protein